MSLSLLSEHASMDTAWAAIAPREHVVQFYKKDELFLDALEAYVTAGLSGGESVIVIATHSHLEDLEDRLRHAGVSLNIARSRNRYITHDAEDLLSHFMVRGWPDEERFTRIADALLSQARIGSPHVRAFGEMVAVLWSRGLTGATIRLEQLWHDLCREQAFSLFCAYPASGFGENSECDIRDICDCHSRVIEARAA